MAKITERQRKDIETLIYTIFDTIDKTKTNSDHYKEIFSKMNNDDFYKFISLKFPYRFHVTPFKIEPSMEDCVKACNMLGVPLMEKITLPYLYTNKDGVPVNTKECMVGYIHLKKVQQFITKKNSMSIDISQRDMKTGLLTGFDKNGKMSDREMESLAILGLDNTMKEFTKPRADAMNAKNAMYNTINTTGMVKLDDIDIDPDDSLSKNLFNTYLIGSHLKSNIISEDYHLPYTLKNKQKAVAKI
ncbi:MAG: hypothetical protein ACRCXT_08080 [Paraclostridium sp.]